MGSADLHIHSLYSWDSTCSLPAILQTAHQAHLNVIAITDHDEVHGALEAQQLGPLFGVEVIPGIEITSAEGHILALFVQQNIPAGLSLQETVLRVGALGGMCIVPHPGVWSIQGASYATIRETLVHPEAAQILLGLETFNAGLVQSHYNAAAEAFASDLPVAKIGSSDAHLFTTIGHGATIFPGDTALDLRRALIERQTTVRRGPTLGVSGFLGSWLPRFLLRVAGWVSWSPTPALPLRLVRLRQAMQARPEGSAKPGSACQPHV